MGEYSHIDCPTCNGTGKVVATEGTRLRDMRLKKRLATQDLSQLCGIGPRRLERIELGHSRATDEEFKAIWEAIQTAAVK